MRSTALMADLLMRDTLAVVHQSLSIVRSFSVTKLISSVTKFMGNGFLSHLIHQRVQSAVISKLTTILKSANVSATMDLDQMIEVFAESHAQRNSSLHLTHQLEKWLVFAQKLSNSPTLMVFAWTIHVKRVLTHSDFPMVLLLAVQKDHISMSK